MPPGGAGHAWQVSFAAWLRDGSSPNPRTGTCFASERDDIQGSLVDTGNGTQAMGPLPGQESVNQALDSLVAKTRQ